MVPDFHVYLTEFPSLVFSSMLKQGKLLKSAACKSGEQGDVVIKVYRKPPPGALGSLDLESELQAIYERLVLIRDNLTLYEVRLTGIVPTRRCCVRVFRGFQLVYVGAGRCFQI